MANIDDKKLQDGLDEFLEDTEMGTKEDACCGGECKVKSKDGLIERRYINKEIIVEDGRKLLL